MASGFKRMRQPKMTTQALLDFDLGESSSDSDFRIEDHNNSDDDCSDASKDDDDDEDDEDQSDSDDSADDAKSSNGGGGATECDNSEDSTTQLKQLLAADVETLPPTAVLSTAADAIEQRLRELDSVRRREPKLPTKPICCVCLGDRSDDSNEIIDCDGCGVSVHEGCYGVNDNSSISSTNSTCSTEPWFCEACRAGVAEPVCELCPNMGGIYKETDVGKWVHLVCALYVPGVAFGEVDQLSSVTLFEMQYNKWGAKMCSLCENSRYARTGVCIGCDAGMCKTYFHVTCAQAAGFLTEAHHDDADAADPFYAHCKVHSEKELIKKRKRNFHTFRLNMQQKQKEKDKLNRKSQDDPCPAQMRIQRKLLKSQQKYASHKQRKATPWVPTQKMSRLLTTSASACRRLLNKAKTMAVDVELLERQEAQIAALTDIRKKWHIAPAFSVEFIAYFLDRISRAKELRLQLNEMMESNAGLSKEQITLRRDYDAKLERNKELKLQQDSLSSQVSLLHKQLLSLCPNKNLPSPPNIGRGVAHAEPHKNATPPARPISVPTAAALKMGVGFPLMHLGPPGTKVDSTKLLSTHVKNPQLSVTPTATTTTTTTTLPANVSAPTSAATTPTMGVQNFDCGICKRFNDQHLLAKCDTCKFHYHLGCLNPPLTRHPKKSKLYGWQCSECDKSDVSDGVAELPKGPRKSRTRFNRDGSIVTVPCVDKALPPGLDDDDEDGEDDDDGPAVEVREMEHIKKRASYVVSPTKSPILSRAADLNTSEKSSSSSWSPRTHKKPKKRTVCPVESPTKLSPLNLKITRPPETNRSPVPMAQPPPSAAEPLVVVLPDENHCEGLKSPPLEDPLALPITASNTTISSLDEMVASTSARQSRKQKRKERHKNKRCLSSDTEKSPNKEHKRKRKKSKLHDHTAKNNAELPQKIPKIKIKFKTLPLPGEVTPEAQFFYVSADMVRSAEEEEAAAATATTVSRPTSVETVEGSVVQSGERSRKLVPKVKLHRANILEKADGPKRSVVRKASPMKATASGEALRKAPFGRPKSGRAALPIQCNVCDTVGNSGNVVTCDECRRNYHFTCLDPPLKKTPKRRGYSWHCADCDPTDTERF